MDDVGDNAPDLEPLSVRDIDGGEVRVGGNQHQALAAFLQAFYREFAMDRSDDGLAHLGLNGPVNNQEVAVVDAGAKHGITHCSYEEGSCGMGDKVLIEIQALVDEVVGGGRKPCLNSVQKLRQRLSMALPWSVDGTEDNQAVGESVHGGS